VIRQLDIDGHSGAYGVGATEEGPKGTGVGSQLARVLGVKEENHARPGATLQETGLLTDGWGEVLHSQPRPPRKGKEDEPLPRAALLFYGGNDLVLYGPDLSVAEEAYRAIISRHRASAVYEETDPSIEPDASWSPLPMGEGEASGEGVLVSKGPASITINVKEDQVRRGGTVALGFLQRLDTAAQYTITVDGKRAGVLKTKSPLVPETTDYVPGHASAPFVFRIEDLRPADHEIEIAVDGVEGEAAFDYWQTEPPNAEPVILVKQYLLPEVKGLPKIQRPPPDKEIIALNRMTDSLAKEFGPRVLAIDTDSVVMRSPTLLAADLLHLGQPGQTAVSQAIYEAMNEAIFAAQLPENAGD
jgi:lysophospholipase L1-like esterase